MIIAEIVYGEIHKQFSPLLHVRFKSMLACLMFKCPDGVRKQQRRLDGRAKNISLLFEINIFSRNWSIRFALVTKHSSDEWDLGNHVLKEY